MRRAIRGVKPPGGWWHSKLSLGGVTSTTPPPLPTPLYKKGDSIMTWMSSVHVYPRGISPALLLFCQSSGLRRSRPFLNPCVVQLQSHSEMTHRNNCFLLVTSVDEWWLLSIFLQADLIPADKTKKKRRSNCFFKVWWIQFTRLGRGRARARRCTKRNCSKIDVLCHIHAFLLYIVLLLVWMKSCMFVPRGRRRLWGAGQITGATKRILKQHRLQGWSVIGG